MPPPASCRFLQPAQFLQADFLLSSDIIRHIKKFEKGSNGFTAIAAGD
jgi:hypothetical protein